MDGENGSAAGRLVLFGAFIAAVGSSLGARDGSGDRGLRSQLLCLRWRE